MTDKEFLVWLAMHLVEHKGMKPRSRAIKRLWDVIKGMP